MALLTNVPPGRNDMCTAHARVAPPRRALRRSRGACLSRQPWRASWDLFQPSAPRAGQLLLTPDLVSMAAISGEIFVLWSVVGIVGKSFLVTQCADVHHMQCAQCFRPMHGASDFARRATAQRPTPRSCTSRSSTRQRTTALVAAARSSLSRAQVLAR